MKVNLVSPVGQIKQAPVGFSWTTFFFTFCVPLFRKDWKWAAIMFVVKLIYRALFFNSDIYIFIIIVILVMWGFSYNKLYIQGLLAKGYKPATDFDAEVIRTKVKIID
ncbi:DUF2628 domain-containing protein [Streptococcus respiraculi]|uniref:DUF2628 domain-containing protein n=1 Tax=Streptococcus respiraculi TaxID=2021971 RepID=UPI000E7076FC|nr:DUF2628 domain-containing protein [Streptococcus respiraculi]